MMMSIFDQCCLKTTKTFWYGSLTNRKLYHSSIQKSVYFISFNPIMERLTNIERKDFSGKYLGNRFSLTIHVAATLIDGLRKHHTCILHSFTLTFMSTKYIYIDGLYWPRVTSRWLDIGQVLFCTLIHQNGVKAYTHLKTNKTNIQPSWPNKLGQ